MSLHPRYGSQPCADSTFASTCRPRLVYGCGESGVRPCAPYRTREGAFRDLDLKVGAAILISDSRWFVANAGGRRVSFLFVFSAVSIGADARSKTRSNRLTIKNTGKLAEPVEQRRSLILTFCPQSSSASWLSRRRSRVWPTPPPAKETVKVSHRRAGTFGSSSADSNERLNLQRWASSRSTIWPASSASTGAASASLLVPGRRERREKN